MTENKQDESTAPRDYSQGFPSLERFTRPGRTIVMMGQGKLVQASEANTEVFTFGAGGCTVVAIEGIRAGRRFGAITHYAPAFLDTNIKKVEQFGSRIENGVQGDETNAVVFVCKRRRIGDSGRVKPGYESQAERLAEAIKKAFGDKTKIRVMFYSRLKEIGNNTQGQVSVDISPQPWGKDRIQGMQY